MPILAFLVYLLNANEQNDTLPPKLGLFMRLNRTM